MLFCLLGASTTIGVAWLLALSDVEWGEAGTFQVDGWDGQQRRAFGLCMIGVQSAEQVDGPAAPPPDWSVSGQPQYRDVLWVQELASGWPLVSMRYAFAAREGSRFTPMAILDSPIVDTWLPDFRFEYDGAVLGRSPLSSARSPWTRRVLPVRPIWGNLAINGVLMGVCWFTLLCILPYCVRRCVVARRVRSALCPVCKYDRRRHQTSENCPECGACSSFRPTLLTRSILVAGVTCLLLVVVAEWIFVAQFKRDAPYHAVHEAAYEGDLDAVRREVAAGDVGDSGCEAWSSASALGIAATQGHVDVAEALINAGADVNHKNDQGMTPLHAAARHADSLELVRLLLDNGADPNAAVRGVHTPLRYAARYSSPDIVKALLDAGAKVDVGGAGDTHVLFDAVRFAAPEVVQMIIDAAPNLRLEDSYDAFEWSAHSLQDSLQANLQASYVSWPTLLAHACVRGNLSIVESLIRAGANVEPNTRALWRPIVVAAANGHDDIVQNLILHGAELDRRVAVAAGGLTTVGALEAVIAQGADIQTVDDANRNALFFLSGKPSAKAVWEFLIVSGLRVNHRDETGRTPLYMAVLRESPSLVQFLLDSGADSTIIPDEHAGAGTLLHVLAEWIGNPQATILANLLDRAALLKMLDVMLQSGVQVDARSPRGETALSIAVKTEQVDLVRLLLEHGAKPTLRINAGETVLDIARDIDNVRILKLLQDAEDSKS